MSIPNWNASGLLPPCDSESAVAASNRSPYCVTVKDLARSLATTPERREIVKGLLEYRASLHALGIVDGFQWVDGSFCTNVEVLEGRAPRDIDVVTFLRLPPGQDAQSVAGRNPRLFQNNFVKADFRCDAYLVSLEDSSPEALATVAAYWSSVWGHTRSGAWKGFLQIPMSPQDDAEALQLIVDEEVEA